MLECSLGIIKAFYRYMCELLRSYPYIISCSLIEKQLASVAASTHEHNNTSCSSTLKVL